MSTAWWSVNGRGWCWVTGGFERRRPYTDLILGHSLSGQKENLLPCLTPPVQLSSMSHFLDMFTVSSLWTANKHSWLECAKILYYSIFKGTGLNMLDVW